MRRFAAALLLLTPPGVHAGDLVGTLVNNLSVAQVVKDKDSIDKPAVFSLQWPKDGDTQKDVSLALTYDFRNKEETFSLGPSFEIQEKTGVASPQSLLKIGLQASWDPFLGSDPIKPKGRVFFSPELAYRKDSSKNTRGLSGAIRITGIAIGKQWSPDRAVPPNANFQFSWLPRIGVEFDHVSKAPAGSPTGTTVRSYAEMEMAAYPFARTFQKRLKLSAALSHRRDFATPDGVRKATHYYRVYSASIALDSLQIFSIGVDRVSGDDPSAGFAPQQFWRLGLRAAVGKLQRELYKDRPTGKMTAWRRR